MRREFSAGGVVVKDGKLLMIKVKTLSGKFVWTFPKGHIEEGETKEIAAIREVEEETGIKAKIKDFIGDFTYYFKDRDGTVVKKTVYWYLMEPEDSSEPKISDEIVDVRWIDLKEAEDIVSYDSDKKILSIIRQKFIKQPEERKT
jgi:8-oxo-dGTP diphosphatase